MEQIGPSFTEKVGAAEDSHYSFFLEGFVWLFSRKYIAQAKYNWGHRVAFQGGYATSFNVATREWSNKIEIKPLVTEENCEELLFVANNAIHILLLDNYGGLNVRSLHKWDTDKKRWIEITLSIDDSSKACSTEPDTRVDCIVADGLKDSKCVYVLVHYDGKTSIHKLCLEQGTFTKACDIKEGTMLLPLGKPTSAMVLGDRLLFTYGVHGCGFRWEPTRAVVVNLTSGEAHEEEIAGERPKFCFSGAKATALKTTGDWLHIAGSTACGMSSSTPCTDIFALSTSGALSWSKLDGNVPDRCCGEDFSAALDQELNILYVTCNEGVVRKSV